MIGRCSCDRHTPAYYWWYLGQLTLCVKTIVLCKLFYQKGGLRLPMYVLYELKIVFSKQTTYYVQLYQNHLLLKCLRFLTTYVVICEMSKQIGKKAFLIKWASEKVLSVTFTFELPFRFPWCLKRFGLENFKLVLLCFLRFQTICHGWHNNRAIFPPPVFRCVYSEKPWIFFFCDDGMTDGTGVSI